VVVVVVGISPPSVAEMWGGCIFAEAEVRVVVGGLF